MDLLPRIEIDGASKTRGNSVVLDQIQLTVKPGEMIGLQEMCIRDSPHSWAANRRIRGESRSEWLFAQRCANVAAWFLS